MKPSKNILLDQTLNKPDARLLAPQCKHLRPVKTVHTNPWFDVRSRGGFFTLEYHAYQVAILPVVADRSIVFVKVKRPVLNDVTWELPAGGTRPKETPLKAAERELREETGIAADSARFHLLPPLAISSTRFPILPHVYQVDLTATEFARRGSHDKEIMEVQCLRFQEVKRLIAQGSIYVSLCVAVLAGFFFRREG